MKIKQLLLDNCLQKLKLISQYIWDTFQYYGGSIPTVVAVSVLLVLTFSSHWSSTVSSLWRIFVGLFQWWMCSQVCFQKAMILPCCFWKDNLSKIDMVHTCFHYAVTCTSAGSPGNFSILLLSSDKCLHSTNRFVLQLCI